MTESGKQNKENGLYRLEGLTSLKCFQNVVNQDSMSALDLLHWLFCWIYFISFLFRFTEVCVTENEKWNKENGDCGL